MKGYGRQAQPARPVTVMNTGLHRHLPPKLAVLQMLQPVKACMAEDLMRNLGILNEGQGRRATAGPTAGRRGWPLLIDGLHSKTTSIAECAVHCCHQLATSAACAMLEIGAKLQF